MPVNQNQKYTPYCYLVGWSRYDKYYYGVRYAEKTKCFYTAGCHPDELWKTYFTSSEYVTEMRKLYGEPDIISIRKTFTNKHSAINWEKRVITRLGAIRNNKWLNKGNRGAILMDDITKEKIRKGNIGKTVTIESRLKISKARLERNITHTDETKEKMREIRGNKIVWSRPFIFKHNNKIYEFLSESQFLKEFSNSAMCILRLVKKHSNQPYILKRRHIKSTHIFFPKDVLFFNWKNV